MVYLGMKGVEVCRQEGLTDHLNVNERGASMCKGLGASLRQCNTNTQTHTCTHANAHTQTHTRTAHTHTHTHTYTHTHTNTHTHAHIHTQLLTLYVHVHQQSLHVDSFWTQSFCHFLFKTDIYIFVTVLELDVRHGESCSIIINVLILVIDITYMVNE